MFQFDHIVHFFNDPIEGIDQLKEIGLYATEGGKHTSLGTYNALSYFDLSYIELIGVYDEALCRASSDLKYSLRETLNNDDFKEGPARICLRADNLEDVAEKFREKGLEFYGPHTMSRTRPDGSVVSWKLLYAGKDDGQLDLPFFIEWDEKDDERREDLTKRGVIADHPKGAVRIDYIGFAVKDLDAAIAKWSENLELEVVETFINESLNATGKKLRIPGGDVVFYTPNGQGVVQDILEKRGEKPFLLQFKNAEDQQVVQIAEAYYRF